MTEAATALAGIAVVSIVAIVRALWRLQDRVSRLEGRMNGRDR